MRYSVRVSYLVLARKWRPRTFSELVGQDHVVRALGNALDRGQVHHAFLFAGTRGVGKTTIARIFAKSLNCLEGVSREPCGKCAVCQEIDAGRFVDLIEIDAASRTKVEDTRDLLDNVAYAPAMGRTKVYLIDEVHMLSNSSFNALLKTLEEPPDHVKFLLATTDPQKLPITVLSRCLRFDLLRLDEQQISGQMAHILQQEQVTYEDDALQALAVAADGSMRDGLSLLDQALAYGNGEVKQADVANMLGNVNQTLIASLVDALVTADANALMEGVHTLAMHSVHFSSALDAVATHLHAIQRTQLLPKPQHGSDETVAQHAAALHPEQVQLWYQMTLTGQRELELAPSPRIGFEMTMLRLLAFSPGLLGDQPVQPTLPQSGQPNAANPASAAPSASSTAAPSMNSASPVAAPPTQNALPEHPTTPSAEATRAIEAILNMTGHGESKQETAPSPVLPPRDNVVPMPHVAPVSTEASAPSAPMTKTASEPKPVNAPSAQPHTMTSAPPPSTPTTKPVALDVHIRDQAHWREVMSGIKDMPGACRELVRHAIFVSSENERLMLALPPELVSVYQPTTTALSGVLAIELGKMFRIELQADANMDESTTLAAHQSRDLAQQKADAMEVLRQDPIMQDILAQPGVTLDEQHIQPSSQI